MPASVVRCLSALALVTGCAEEVFEPAPLAGLCGAEGPVRVLPLSPDQRPVPEDSIVRVGARIVVLVGSGDAAQKSGFGPLPAATTAWSIGPCGEDPVIVGEGLTRIFTVPQWPDVALALSSAVRYRRRSHSG